MLRSVQRCSHRQPNLKKHSFFSVVSVALFLIRIQLNCRLGSTHLYYFFLMLSLVLWLFFLSSLFLFLLPYFLMLLLSINFFGFLPFSFFSVIIFLFSFYWSYLAVFLSFMLISFSCVVLFILCWFSFLYNCRTKIDRDISFSLSLCSLLAVFLSFWNILKRLI